MAADLVPHAPGLDYPVVEGLHRRLLVREGDGKHEVVPGHGRGDHVAVEHVALGVDLHLLHSRTAPEVVLEALFHTGLADHRNAPVAVDAGAALVVLVLGVLGCGDLADIPDDIGRRLAVGVVAHGLGLDHHAGQEGLVLVDGEDGGGTHALGHGHGLVGAVLDAVDGCLHLGHGLAQQRREFFDDARVGRLRPGQDRHHLFDAVAGQQHAVAVEYLAPGGRDVNRHDALGGDLGDGGSASLDALEEPEPAEKGGEEAGHYDQHGRGPQPQRAWLRWRRGNRLSHPLTVPRPSPAAGGGRASWHDGGSGGPRWPSRPTSVR